MTARGTRNWYRVVGAALFTIMSASCQGSSTPPVDVDAAISTGSMLYQSEGCANCHGPKGEGDVGPDLSGVIDTFPSCDTQVTWVSLGSARWNQEMGSSYGDSNKPVRGGMPGFEERLEEEQIRKIASYTRSEFAGGDDDRVVGACL